LSIFSNERFDRNAAWRRIGSSGPKTRLSPPSILERIPDERRIGGRSYEYQNSDLK